jgi:hypothetical protein
MVLEVLSTQTWVSHFVEHTGERVAGLTVMHLKLRSLVHSNSIFSSRSFKKTSCVFQMMIPEYMIAACSTVHVVREKAE